MVTLVLEQAGGFALRFEKANHPCTAIFSAEEGLLSLARQSSRKKQFENMLTLLIFAQPALTPETS